MSDSESEVKVEDGIEFGKKEVSLRCRYYERKFPRKKEMVMVEVNDVTDVGAMVSLLEYDGLEGMILLSEMTRRRIRSVNRLVRQGKKEIVVVLRVDERQGHVDLSKKRVTAKDVEQFKVKWNSAKTAYGIMATLATRVRCDVQDLYDCFGYDMAETEGTIFQGLYHALNMSPEDFYKKFPKIPKFCYEQLHPLINQKLATKKLKLRTAFELKCFGQRGINAIKDSIRAGLKYVDEQNKKNKTKFKVDIQLVAPPQFVMTTTVTTARIGFELLKRTNNVISEAIQKEDGEYDLITEPQVVSKSDETKLLELMKKMAKENQEIDGDEE